MSLLSQWPGRAPAGPSGRERKGPLIRKPYRDAARSRDEHVARPTLGALAAGAGGLPVPARFARSVEPEDALASLDEPTRRAEEG
ncbi:hypothetical protein AB0B45_36645 [Nonomuraea sp. NPDC049152]|uniref:hypothetical protein n=1 Tax=Nonomuraea sp. NPDC049152 TaxID=3154350 RepID=UPI0033CC9913